MRDFACSARGRDLSSSSMSRSSFADADILLFLVQPSLSETYVDSAGSADRKGIWRTATAGSLRPSRSARPKGSSTTSTSSSSTPRPSRDNNNCAASPASSDSMICSVMRASNGYDNDIEYQHCTLGMYQLQTIRSSQRCVGGLPSWSSAYHRSSLLA